MNNDDFNSKFDDAWSQNNSDEKKEKIQKEINLIKNEQNAKINLQEKNNEVEENKVEQKDVKKNKKKTLSDKIKSFLGID